ncbi:sugar transferase [Mucilaginibacter sp. 44-25]|uniref:sugar transferase n=1 Tax=Mucilaginibacter sp. 44-25 TaxID=1895794 RepID=UPI0009615C1B|nr:sugar transferase [Mucilaginibacter sp. 44-25]OJW18062.1 MAG: glycosyl transferase [Mucilaginibacter sp. 44-25]
MTPSTATDWNQSSNGQVRVAYAGTELKDLIAADLSNSFSITFNDTVQELETFLGEQSIITVPDIILVEVDKDEECFALVERLRKNMLMNGLIIVMLSTQKNKEQVLKAMRMKLHDFYTYPFATSDLRERLNFLVRFKLIKPRLLELSKEVDTTYRMPWGKRALDLFISCTMLICLMPIMLIVAILIKLDSKGPVFYKSKRVGTGYKVFDFYKFRSMRTDADQLLAKMAEEHNQYAAEEEGANKAAFVKFKNDPRITKLGSFLRSSSLDELPQLFNILRGDMSVVGNRPLPVYEAEMLTSNEWSMRFLGPAGLTGLWQISKRGKEDMSERERKKLDNFYAQKYSLWLDLKIIIGTVPALFQKEKV